MQTVTLLKRGDDQQQGIITNYTLFGCRRGQITKTGQTLQGDMVSNHQTTWHIPQSELDHVGVTYLNVLDRILDPDGNYWQPESDTTLTQKLFKNHYCVECYLRNPPLNSISTSTPSIGNVATIPPAPQIVLQDTFSRRGNLATSPNMTVIGEWYVVGGSPGSDAAPFILNNGQCDYFSPGDQVVASSGYSDAVLSVIVNFNGIGNTDVGLIFRADAGCASGSPFWFLALDAVAGQLVLNKWNGVAFVQAYVNPLNIQLTSDYLLGITCKGPSILVSLNGLLQATVIDSYLVGNTYHGIEGSTIEGGVGSLTFKNFLVVH